MRYRLVLIALFAGLTQTPAYANEPGPPNACVTAIYDEMSGTWGLDDETFVPNHIPVSAWNIIPQNGDIVAMLTNGETNVWFLTEHGADWTHDLRNGSYEGLFVATELLSCRQSSGEQPAILETSIRTGAQARLRHRIELSADRLIIQQFDRRNAIVSERRMRRYSVMAIDPPPPPPGH
jgi:hypothetical protein